MKKSTLLIFSLLSGLLLALPWYQNFSGIISTIAFLPLLIIEDHIYKTKESNEHFILFRYSSLTFLIWNVIATYWIKNSDIIAAITVILTNTLFMSLTFGLFHITKRKFGSKVGNFSFIIYWLCFEYIFLNAELTWPWLNLGNAFANDIKLIQWYEYTGVLGGSLWILILNLILFRAFKSYIEQKNLKFFSFKLSIYIFFLIVPILISNHIFRNYKEDGKGIKIAVLQPNFDPYSEKYNISQDEQLNTIMSLADSIIDGKTDYIIAPETAINKPIWEYNLSNDSSILSIREFIHKHPNIKFIIGASTLKKTTNKQKSLAITRYNKTDSSFYIAFNAALQIDTTDKIPIYYKSKLVSGVETMPYLHFLPFLEKFILDFGGVIGSLGTQNEREVFYHSNNKFSIAPVICYESAFGEHVSDYIKKGASLIFVITNDGWWSDTPGYKQHLNCSQLRAIENRRSIARSANTGISAFINQRGEIVSNTAWWEKSAIKDVLKTNNKITFYTRYGDYIGRLARFLSILLVLYLIVNHLIKKDNKKVAL
jgi:apolipoprotein N-acyltransferase